MNRVLPTERVSLATQERRRRILGDMSYPSGVPEGRLTELLDLLDEEEFFALCPVPVRVDLYSPLEMPPVVTSVPPVMRVPHPVHKQVRRYWQWIYGFA